MNTFYTIEKNNLILIALLKAHGIKKIITSPGGTNICFVASIQQDSFFQIYSCVDERSAAYMACGLAEESGETIAISCTGATASRNYYPGLTEAYYRKLPILAITSSQHLGRIGNDIPQFTDRTQLAKDIVRISVQIPEIHTREDEWAYTVQMNRAILALAQNGGGPAHINISTNYSSDFSIKKLPDVTAINRINYYDEFPVIDKKKIAIFVGAHSIWSKQLLVRVEEFCEQYNGIVLCDHTSNYHGNYKILANLILEQEGCKSSDREFDLIIHIGNISGAYMKLNTKEVWHVNLDGEIRDTFRKLTKVFAMREEDFFAKCISTKEKDVIVKSPLVSYYKELYNSIYDKIPSLIFSNIWVAKKMAMKLPSQSVLYLGILNSLRSWNFFHIDSAIHTYATTGGFGIDGGVSSVIGASIVDKEKFYFCVAGDLAFFYDMNSIGNRHIANNLRLMIINNGKGAEFRLTNSLNAQLGDEIDRYIGGGGHYGNKSRCLIQSYAENLGFEYMCASNKEEFMQHVDRFVSPESLDKPIIFEIFTESNDEANALHTINNIIVSPQGVAKDTARTILGPKGVSTLKRILR